MKTHSLENNPESQKHLNENKKKFSAQCLKVLELLRQGKRLTTMNAPGYGILSLPRRIKDLRDHNGINNIVDEWDEERGIKVWYMKFITTHQIRVYRNGKEIKTKVKAEPGVLGINISPIAYNKACEFAELRTDNLYK